MNQRLNAGQRLFIHYLLNIGEVGIHATVMPRNNFIQSIGGWTSILLISLIIIILCVTLYFVFKRCETPAPIVGSFSTLRPDRELEKEEEEESQDDGQAASSSILDDVDNSASGARNIDSAVLSLAGDQEGGDNALSAPAANIDKALKIAENDPQTAKMFSNLVADAADVITMFNGDD